MSGDIDKMLAYTVKQEHKSIYLTCSDGRTLLTDDFTDATGFILEPSPDYSVVWDVNVLADALFAIMPKTVADTIRNGGRTHFMGRKFFYMPNKLVGMNQINFYSLEKYADQEPADAKQLLVLAKNVINLGFMPIIHKKPTKLTSMVAAYSECLVDLQFPRAEDLSNATFGKADSLLKACEKTMKQDWRDTYQIGHWDGDKITNYDITYAYPSIIQDLPDITRADFFESDTMPEKYDWGELEGTISVNCQFSPFYDEQTKGYPNGTFPISISTDLLWVLERFNLGQFRLEHGHFLTLPQNRRKPFEYTMKCLYNARSINPMARIVSKGIAVGIGGQFQESHMDGNVGDNYNPIYARMMKARCTAKVATFIYYNNLTPISVLVDGILAEERLDLPTKHESGKWRISDDGQPALVVTDQNQWIGDKRPAGINYAKLVELIDADPDKRTYFGGVIDLNALRPQREYEKLPTSGRELLENRYKSQPVKI